MSDTDPDPLLILLSRAARGVLLPEEGDQLRQLVNELEAERDRYRAAWKSARARVKRAKRNRDSELRWANAMWSDALRDLGRYRKAWTSARHRAATYLQSNQNFSANIIASYTEWHRLQARIRELEQAEAAIERVQALADIAPAGAQGPTWAALDLAIRNALDQQSTTEATR